MAGIGGRRLVTKADLRDALELAVFILSTYEPSREGTISEEYRALRSVSKGDPDAKALRVIRECLATFSPPNEKRLERYMVTLKDGEVIVRDRAVEALEARGIMFARV